MEADDPDGDVCPPATGQAVVELQALLASVGDKKPAWNAANGKCLLQCKAHVIYTQVEQGLGSGAILRLLWFRHYCRGGI